MLVGLLTHGPPSSRRKGVLFDPADILIDLCLADHADGNGLISRDEARAMFGKDPEGNDNPNFDEEFDEIDTNGDGSVDPAEFEAGNKDGIILNPKFFSDDKIENLKTIINNLIENYKDHNLSMDDGGNLEKNSDSLSKYYYLPKFNSKLTDQVLNFMMPYTQMKI